MAIQRDTTYPGRWGTATADYPGGVPQNRTTPTSADGSYLEEKLWKDTFGGVIDAAIAQGDITRSGVPDTAQSSDVIDGLKAIMATQSLEWSASRNYNHPVIVSGSDGELYLSVQDNGPATTVQDPTTDVSDTYWILLADVIGVGGVEAWSSGTDYTNPVQVYGSDNRLYISQQDSGPSGVGAQDPTTDDGTYWRVLDNSFAYQYFYARDEKISGTQAGTFNNGSWVTRVLNTVVENNITGASLSSNQITLPAGRYYIHSNAPARDVGPHKAKLYNVTDASDEIIGTSEDVGTTAAQSSRSFVRGGFEIASTKTFELRHRCVTTGLNDGLGNATSFGAIEVYAEIEIWKVK